MPYASKAQAGFMHAKHPGIAARWDKEGGSTATLPDKVNEQKDAIKRAMKKKK